MCVGRASYDCLPILVGTSSDVRGFHTHARNRLDDAHAGARSDSHPSGPANLDAFAGGDSDARCRTDGESLGRSDGYAATHRGPDAHS